MNDSNHSVITAREGALVDAQCLLQMALNEVLGNPRDHEEADPKRTAELFKKQREYLAEKLETTLWRVDKFFADDSKLSVKDLAGALSVLGYSLEMNILHRPKRHGL